MSLLLFIYFTYIYNNLLVILYCGDLDNGPLATELHSITPQKKSNFSFNPNFSDL